MILDTHVWLRYLDGEPLSRPCLRAIEKQRLRGNAGIAAVTLWELALLDQKGRYRLDAPLDAWVADALRSSGVIVVPLEAAIAREAARLIGVLKDPSDCQIAGTALSLGLPLATRDERIVRSAARLGLDVIEA